MDFILRVRRYQTEKDANWFAFDEARPLAVFAGIWTSWHGKAKHQGQSDREGHQLFGFLTTDANDVAGAIHPKAMPVILTTADEIETWMTAPAEDTLKLRRPLADGALKIVAQGEREDK